MGVGPVRYVVLPPRDPWGVFDSPAPRVTVYVNTLPPTPWIFRSANRPFVVLVVMLALAVGAVLIVGRLTG